MSDYKVVATDIQIVDRECLIQALEAMFGPIEQNVVAEQRWSNHNRRVDICIRQAQLPAELQGFGDVGLVQRGSKFEFLGISDHDSHYIDADKRRQLEATGMSPRQAQTEQPDGTFANEMNGYFKKIENGYNIFSFVKEIRSKCPSVEMDAPTGDASDDRAWMMRGRISKRDLAAMGVQVPR